jgi:hypothetical protein
MGALVSGEDFSSSREGRRICVICHDARSESGVSKSGTFARFV